MISRFCCGNNRSFTLLNLNNCLGAFSFNIVHIQIALEYQLNNFIIWAHGLVCAALFCNFFPNNQSKANFSFQFITSYVWYIVEKLAGDLLFGLNYQFSQCSLYTLFMAGWESFSPSSSQQLPFSLFFCVGVIFVFHNKWQIARYNWLSTFFDKCKGFIPFWIIFKIIKENSTNTSAFPCSKKEERTDQFSRW